jgi:hypothetical protein
LEDATTEAIDERRTEPGILAFAVEETQLAEDTWLREAKAEEANQLELLAAEMAADVANNLERPIYFVIATTLRHARQ